MISWNDIARDMIHERDDLPEQIKGSAKDLIEGLIGSASQIVGNLELVYRRGVQAGYEEGYKDAQSTKPSRF